jgi:hypothetical protein
MAGGDDLLGVGNGCRLSASGISHDHVGSLATPLDPRLGPLARNGGPTRTRALLAGSPASDAAAAPCGEATDQRGVRRPREQPATSAPLRSRWPLVTGVVAHDAGTRLTAECPTKTDVSPKCSWREHTDEVSVVDPTTYSCRLQVKAESAQTVPFAALRRSVLDRLLTP